MGVEEEAEARREVVDPQAPGEGVLDIGHPVGDREGQLLDRGRAGLADVVAADRDRVPARHLVGPELDRVGHEAHRGPGREEELFLGDELLEDVVLRRALEGGPRHPGLLGGDDVHRPDRSGRAVDRHRRADLIERKAGEEDLHVCQARHRDAAGSELALRLRVVGVVAVQGRHVVGDREPGLAGGEKRAEPGIRVLGGAEPGEHPHRPETAAVARRVDAAGEWRLAGQADVAKRVDVVVTTGVDTELVAVVILPGRPASADRTSIGPRLPGPGAVETIDGGVADRAEPRASLGRPTQGAVEPIGFPGALPGRPGHGRDSSTGPTRHRRGAADHLERRASLAEPVLVSGAPALTRRSVRTTTPSRT